MKRFDLADSSFFSSTADIGRCYLGKLLYVTKGRSNQSGPCGFTGRKLKSLFLNLREAEDYIDEKKGGKFVRRKKGTYWKIWQLPVAVIVGSDSAKLVIAEPIGFWPLTDYAFTLPTKRKFGPLAKALMSPFKNDQYALNFYVDVPFAVFPFVTQGTPPPDLKEAAKIVGDPIERWVNDGEVDATAAIQIVYKICLWLADTSK